MRLTLPSRGQVQDQRQTEEEGGRAPSPSLAQLLAELASLGEAEKKHILRSNKASAIAIVITIAIAIAIASAKNQ